MALVVVGLRMSSPVPAGEFVGGLVAAVHEFSGGAEQSDDITILALRFHGPGEPGTFQS
jgi:serine phosphatase RsbU (regulator of sigma subunit)